jgi:hypothetical protein
VPAAGLLAPATTVRTPTVADAMCFLRMFVAHFASDKTNEQFIYLERVQDSRRLVKVDGVTSACPRRRRI